jgi:3-dehydroquinate synthase
MEKISLSDYDIFVGVVWAAINELLEACNYSKIVILVDENTRQHCLPILLSNTTIENPEIVKIPSGEIHKNIETCNFIWQQMIDKQLDRNAVMINLGGGVIGDIGGFCASTFKRGIEFIQMPTTLLSQVDSSIGGKLGIDFGDVKNSIGLFENPKAVFIFPGFLKTLSRQEIRSGFAEMIKHGLIADAQIWEELKSIEDFEDIDWLPFIIPSLKIKKQIVEADPFEKNVRKKLNFGHTIGHAIESFALDSEKPLLHGEAIAAGMICEAWLSLKKGNLSEEALSEVVDYILKIYGKVDLAVASFPALLDLMKNDKKNEGRAINFSMLLKPGEALINHTCDEKRIVESLKYYNNL